jgi:hypothetical protein
VTKVLFQRFALFLILLGALAMPARAQLPFEQVLPAIPRADEAPVAMLVDITSGQVLHARNPDRRFMPASVTKVMTLYLAFELIEQIRKLSVAYRRDADADADRALNRLLKSLSGDQAVSVIRAFTYFSHLANLAEDRDQIRRHTQAARAGAETEGSLAVALLRLRGAAIAPAAVVRLLKSSYLSPVLTAHPTEVQRKSILDAERGIALLLAERESIRAQPDSLDNGSATPIRDALKPRQLAANDLQLRARVMQLWQTRLLRPNSTKGRHEARIQGLPRNCRLSTSAGKFQTPKTAAGNSTYRATIYPCPNLRP